MEKLIDVVGTCRLFYERQEEAAYKVQIRCGNEGAEGWNREAGGEGEKEGTPPRAEVR